MGRSIWENSCATVASWAVAASWAAQHVRVSAQHRAVAAVRSCLQPRGWEKLLIQIRSPCSARPTSSCGNYHLFRSACRAAHVGTPNLLWSTQARVSLNGLSRRFLLTHFDWSGLRGARTSISANRSWGGINSQEEATTSGWDYQPLLLTQLNQESTWMRPCRFRDAHEFSLRTAEITVSHQLLVAAVTAALGGRGSARLSHFSKKLVGFTGRCSAAA